MSFDLNAYREAHPQATPEECRLAHQEAIAEALHEQFLALFDQMADRIQLTVLAGGSVQVGINLSMPEETPAPSKPTLAIVQ